MSETQTVFPTSEHIPYRAGKGHSGKQAGRPISNNISTRAAGNRSDGKPTL